MARFVQLINYTADGIERFEEAPELNEQARALADELGGEIVDIYVTLGQYDAVAVVEVPDAEAALTGTITMAKTGTIETETLRAFDEEEIEDVIAGLPE